LVGDIQKIVGGAGLCGSEKPQGYADFALRYRRGTGGRFAEILIELYERTGERAA